MRTRAIRQFPNLDELKRSLFEAQGHLPVGFSKASERPITLKQLLSDGTEVLERLTWSQKALLTVARLGSFPGFSIRIPGAGEITQQQAILQVIDPLSPVGAKLIAIELRMVQTIIQEAREAQKRTTPRLPASP